MDPQTTMILNNQVLPIKIGNREFPTPEHYVLSSLLKGKLHQDILLSYPVDKIQHVFNHYDQEQFLRVMYDACNQFNEKKCRSVKQKDGKSIGSQVRALIKGHHDFLYQTTPEIPFFSTIGLMNQENVLYGFNIVAHSILRMKYALEKLPDLSNEVAEYLFWKMNPERHAIADVKSLKTYKTIVPKKQKTKTRTEKTRPEPSAYIYIQADETHEDNDEMEEEGFYPEEVPVYRDDRVRWIATNVNSRLDDMRDVGAKADFLYTTETMPTDPFYIPTETDLYSRTDPFYIFKIYKASEYLVGMIQNGFDIKSFLHKPVDAILWEGRVSPELFGMEPQSLSPKQRHMIYVEYWHKFMSKTIPCYSFIEKEIMYPQNLAGFIRKEYVLGLNDTIGQKIKEVLFASFLYQVIEKSYPSVAPELKIIVMKREMQKFSTEEYNDITGKLYHLFFQKKFQLDEEGFRRITLFESYRLTTTDIQEALHYMPCKITTSPSFSINDTLLDPLAEVDVQIDDKLFHDLFQYLYYRLFMFYGGISTDAAYQLLFDKGEMMRGNHPKLQETLLNIIHTQKTSYYEEAISNKYIQYPQVQEIILYSRATKQPIRATEDGTILSVWNDIKTNPLDLQLMEWVVSVLNKKDPLHFEKSVYLYFFIHDMMRSMGLMRSILGRRIQPKPMEKFFQCFYPKLETIYTRVATPKKQIPKALSSYLDKKNVATEPAIQDIWLHLQPIVYLFQQEKFVPSQLFQETKKKYRSISREDLIHALANVVRCLYPDQDVPNDHFYIITQIISGKDNIPMWSDPSFEMVRETEEDNGPHPLLEELRKKIPHKKSKKPKMEIVKYNIIHPFYETRHNALQEAFGRSSYDPVVSRASYALAALEKETIHPRRIVFYL